MLCPRILSWVKTARCSANFGPWLLQDVYAKYTVSEKLYKTKPIPNTTNPDWNGKDLLTVKVDDAVSITNVFCAYQDSAVMFWGRGNIRLISSFK